MSRNNAESGLQGTDKPWERPGQSSQNPSTKPPERKDREGRYEAPTKAARDSAAAHSTSAPGLRRIEDRPTEDDIAQAALGGPKGSTELPPAPLTKTEREQNLPNDEPGHVA